MEAEFSFTKSVENFAREAVKAGRYRGAYNLNLKEQMRKRVVRAVEAEQKVKVLSIGASEVSRIRNEWGKMGEGKLEVREEIRVKGYLSRGEGARVEAEMEAVEISPDVVLIGGPGNSLMEHEGGGKERAVLRKLTVKKGAGGEVVGLGSVYHLVEAVKLSMCERKQIAVVLVSIFKKSKELWPLAEIYYLDMFPRYIAQCCATKGHMTSVDPQVVQQSRLELEEDISDEVRRSGERVVRLHWWSPLGAYAEPTLEWIRERRVVSEDGVHLDPKKRALVAAFLYRRLAEGEMTELDAKRRKLSI